jgi:hypothetical protein
MAHLTGASMNAANRAEALPTDNPLRLSAKQCVVEGRWGYATQRSDHAVMLPSRSLGGEGRMP